MSVSWTWTCEHGKNILLVIVCEIMSASQDCQLRPTEESQEGRNRSRVATVNSLECSGVDEYLGKLAGKIGNYCACYFQPSFNYHAQSPLIALHLDCWLDRYMITSVECMNELAGTARHRLRCSCVCGNSMNVIMRARYTADCHVNKRCSTRQYKICVCPAVCMSVSTAK